MLSGAHGAPLLFHQRLYAQLLKQCASSFLLPLAAAKCCVCLKIECVNHTQPLVSPVFCEKPVCNPGQKFEGRCFRRDCVRCGWERKWHHGISFRKLRVREEAGD
ncbi:hypothetical protein AD937_03780 [Gluconobacter japonicus]|nr:hypothetical protein AD937_03780 [Gluconobacter japonicus]KXV28642.1 hypothetical protein AD938_03975 [Gluconobacter japonicus]